MRLPDSELRGFQNPLNERLSTTEPECLRWGNISMVSVGLGKEFTNEQLIDRLPREVLNTYGLVSEDGSPKPEKIRSLTGIERRFQIPNSDGEMPLPVEEGIDLINRSSVAMGKLALEDRGWKPSEVDILATLSSYPQEDFGSYVRTSLGLVHASLVETTTACSGPAVALLRLGELQDRFPQGANVLVTGAEVLSPFSEKDNLLLFSDRTGAMTFVLGKEIRVLTPYLPGVTIREYPDEHGAFSIAQTRYTTDGMNTDGRVIYFKKSEAEGKVEILSRNRYQESDENHQDGILLRMNGTRVAKWMASETPKLIADTAEVSGKDLTRITMIIPHQANGRLLNMLQRGITRVTGIPKHRIPPVYSCCESLGNCSSQTTFYALMKALQGDGLSDNQKIQNGDELLITAFGAGLASAAAVIQVNSGEEVFKQALTPSP